MGFNLGTPDASYYNIACGSVLVIDLGDPAPYIGHSFLMNTEIQFHLLAGEASAWIR